METSGGENLSQKVCPQGIDSKETWCFAKRKRFTPKCRFVFDDVVRARDVRHWSSSDAQYTGSPEVDNRHFNSSEVYQTSLRLLSCNFESRRVASEVVARCPNQGESSLRMCHLWPVLSITSSHICHLWLVSSNPLMPVPLSKHNWTNPLRWVNYPQAAWSIIHRQRGRPEF